MLDVKQLYRELHVVSRCCGRFPKKRKKLIGQTACKTKPIRPKRDTICVTKGPTDYSPMAIRNTINQKLGSIVVAKVATSQKNNFVVTLLPNYRASEFINQKAC